MSKSIFYVYLVLITAKLIINSTEELHDENKLLVFYLNDGIWPKESPRRNTSWFGDAKSINADLCVGHLPLKENLQDNLNSFCEIFRKENVVALLFFPGLRAIQLFYLVQMHSPVPLLHFQQSSQNNERGMNINLIPSPNDSVEAIMRLLQELSLTPDAVAVIYNSKSENAEAKMRVDDFSRQNTGSNQSITFYKIISNMSTEELIRQVTEILAKIKLSKIKNLLLYVNTEEVDELLSIAHMIQMTTEEYTWIIPWQIRTSKNLLPVNAITLRVKNMTEKGNLLIDSFEVVIRSLRAHGKKTERSSLSAFHSAGCLDDTDRSSIGEELYRRMVKQSFTGKTGNVQFDARGNRINADYELVKLANGKVVWPERASVVKMLRSPDEKKQRNQRRYRAVTALTEPFAFTNKIVNKRRACGTGLPCKFFLSKENKSTQFCCDGMMIDLLHMLEVDLYLDIELHVSKDGRYGAFDEKTSQWNGMIGELMRDEADMAIADLTITDDRSRVVDFTHPFMEVGTGVMVRAKRKSGKKGVWGFLEPVATQLWITAIVAIFAMGTLFWAMEKVALWIKNRFSSVKNRRKIERKRQASARFSFGASLHYSWSTVVRTRDKVTPPSNTSAKIGTIGLALCFLVFVTTYTAQLAAFLVAEEPVTPITGGIQDSKLQNPPEGLVIAAVSGTSTARFFRTSTEPIFTNIWRQTKGNNVPDMDVAVERLKKGEIDVFFDDYPTLVYQAAKDANCVLRVLGEPFFKSGFAVALQKSSSLTSVITQKLLEYEKYDVFLTLSHRWLKSSCSNTENEDRDFMDQNNFHRMSSQDLSGVFLIVAGGIVMSSVLLAVEYFIRRARK